ncbi:hypothetical protein GGI10_005805, partial [Coemansia sp. RSA 2530]
PFTTALPPILRIAASALKRKRTAWTLPWTLSSSPAPAPRPSATCASAAMVSTPWPFWASPRLVAIRASARLCRPFRCKALVKTTLSLTCLLSAEPRASQAHSPQLSTARRTPRPTSG